MQENILTPWFANRRINVDILKEFGIHWGINNIMGECIVIPVHDEQGVLFFNKYRRNPLQDAKPKYIYDKGGQNTLYGWWKAKDYEHILITEGELDALMAWSHNIPSVTATGGALSFQEHWAEYLADKEVTLCFDNDEAGAKGMVKALRILPHAHVMFVPDRPDVKDLTDYVKAGGDIHELMRTRVHFKNLQHVIDDRASRLATWKSVKFHDAYIKEHTVPAFVRTEYKGAKDGDKLGRAKQHPITNFVKFRQNKAKCIWHQENSPSMHYYKDTNSVYCFGCGKYGDSVDVYRQINNCGFQEAIDNLS